MARARHCTLAWGWSIATMVAMTTGAVAACSDKSEPAAPSSDSGAADVIVEAAPVDDAGDASDAGIDCSDAGAGPEHLFCTGLYADWKTKTLAPGVMPYDPGYHLWSDGAEKSRYVWLPPGTKIDTSNMDEWTFPVGTKFWKEFKVGQKLVETRLTEKLEGVRHWRRVAFRWNADQSGAFELPKGEVGVDGTTYEIPSSAACDVCHEGRIDGVLGFEAIELSSAHATGLTMSELVARDLVTNAPKAPIVVPGDPATQDALGYLHANCGIPCHSQSLYANANWIQFFMRLTTDHLATPEDTDTYKTGVGKGSSFQLAGSDAGLLYRIMPKNPQRSAIIVRAGTRDAELKIQMPPLISHQVDDAGIQTLSTWIDSL